MMPNFVFCEAFENYLPEEYKDRFSEVDWGDVAFATTNICRDSVFSEYEITEEGHMYERNPDDKGGIERIDFTGEIELIGAVIDEEFDHEVHARALFFKGDLKEFEFLKSTERDNSERKKMAESVVEAVLKAEAKSSSLWNGCVSFVFSCVRNVLGFSIRLCWIIQHKIT